MQDDEIKLMIYMYMDKFVSLDMRRELLVKEMHNTKEIIFRLASRLQEKKNATAN